MKTLREFFEKKERVEGSEREKLFEEFEQEHGIEGLIYDARLVMSRTGDMWYGGSVILFSYKDLQISISAIGDVDVNVFLLNEEGDIVEEDNICDHSNSGVLGDYLLENGVTSDSEVQWASDLIEKEDYDPSQYKGYKAIVDYSFGNNNWVEVYATDEKEEYYNDDGVWSLDDVLAYDFDELLKEICANVERERNKKLERKEEEE